MATSAAGCCLSRSRRLPWFDTGRALVCCRETRGLMFYSNIREGGIEEKGSRMSTKKLSCANKQNRWIIPCCLRRELLECPPAAGAPRSCWGPGLVFHRALAPAPPTARLGLMEQSASRSFPRLWPGCTVDGHVLKELGMFQSCMSCTSPQASSATCSGGEQPDTDLQSPHFPASYLHPSLNPFSTNKDLDQSEI